MKVSISKKGRAKVQIDPHDLWSLDYTLARVIHPALVEFRKDMMGAPFTDNNDVPEELRSDIGMNGDSDTHSAKWDWIVDEMIWAFGEMAKDKPDMPENYEEMAESEDRTANALRLFGKYYQGLWQ